MTADDYYRQGCAYRQQGNFQEAINSFAEAVRLDPDSPAATARLMLDDIMAFYNRDAYNP